MERGRGIQRTEQGYGQREVDTEKGSNLQTEEEIYRK